MATDDHPLRESPRVPPGPEGRGDEPPTAPAPEFAAENARLTRELEQSAGLIAELRALLEHEASERKETEAAFQQMNELLEATIEERTADIRDKLLLIERQQEMLLLLSTPVIPIWDGVLVLPLIGAIDARRASQIMETALHAVVRHRARILILDVTGAPLVDAEGADSLARTARAAALLGVACMLVGISPQAAQALVTSGADLAHVDTFGALQSGLEEALRRMRYRVMRA
jgi:anti-anti-sigma regulatory factor